MPRTMAAPKAEDMSADPTRLEAEGEFHFYVKDIRDGMKPYNDDALEGFSVILQVLGGEHDGKSIGVTFRDGQMTHKDGGEFCRKMQAAFCVGTNLLSPQQLNGSDVSFDEQAALNHQVIAAVKLGKPTDAGKRYLDLDGLKIYHVDDPRVADVAKSAEALAAIDPAFRRPAEFFAPLVAAKKGAAASSTAKSATPQSFDAAGL